MRAFRNILILLPLFVSCSRDGAVVAVPEADDERTIVFSLSGSAPQTRATAGSVGNEDVVSRVDVFFYDAAGGLLFYPDTRQISHDTSAQKVTITIPESVYATILGRPLTVFIVANTALTRAQMESRTLAELNALVTENGAGTLFNTGGQPATFLMTGQTPATITAGTQNLGSVVLRRAAAKIVIDITSAAVADYHPLSARVRISNFLDKTALGDETLPSTLSEGDYKTSDWVTLTHVEQPGDPFTMDDGDALYSYFNDWSGNFDRESYLTLEMEWFHEGDGGLRRSYYRIPFSYINAAGADEHRDRVRRNYIYRFLVDVKELGGIDPESAVDVSANFDVIDWTDRRVEVAILSYNYLFVYNSVARAYNTDHFTWEYRSSLDITLGNVSASCTEFLSTGGTRNITYVEGDPQWPEFELRNENGATYIDLEVTPPDNYVPLEISFTVSNAAGLTFDVALTILPPNYVTSTFSDGGTNQNRYPRAGAYNSSTGTGGSGNWGNNNPDGAGSDDNFNFYRITTTSLEARQIMIGGRLQTIMLGDPTHPVEHPFNDIGTYYQTDPDANHVISPSFVVASRRGITTPMSWTTARERCTRYREAQYPAGSWRVPTFAELALLGNMQNDENSAIKGLFVPVATGPNPGWWTALNAYRMQVHLYDFDSGNGVEQDGTGSVRCVHDTWRDNG
jgi:hypothetical protein